MRTLRAFSILLVIAILASATIAAAPVKVNANGVTHVVSAWLEYGPNGWGGWSCPIGMTVVDAGIQDNDHDVAQALVWKPGASVDGYDYPETPFGYTYSEGEEGYIVQNNNVGQELRIWLDCAPPPPPWTGEPDPYACNRFGDCRWTLPVCIDGTTYVVGIYYDPTGVNPEKIAADALYWTGTVLTAGACKGSGMIDLGNMVRVENTAKYPGQPCFVIAPRGTDPGVESMTRTCESKDSWLDGKAREGFIGFDAKTGKMEAKITARGEVFFISWDNTWGLWVGDPNDNRRAPVLFTEEVGRNLLHQFCQLYKQNGTPKVLGAALCG